MKKLLQRLFSKTPKIKKFSPTFTAATEGSDAKKDLDPEIKRLVSRILKKDTIENKDLNKLIQFYFNVKEIPPAYYKLNSDLVKGMVLDVVSADIETNSLEDVTNIHLVMREIVYNVDLTVKISVRDFHEFLLPIEPVEVN